MSTDKPTTLTTTRNPFLSWEVLLLYSLLCAVVVVMFEKPHGSISGTIALEEKKFGLHSYNVRQNKVYAVATGPRDGITLARGVWVSNDGSFKIDQLPIGEYEIKVRAPGFQTAYVNSIFVEQGKNQAVPDPIKLEILEPSVSIASQVRVFTTKESPSFWVSATGASQTKVKVYKKNFLAVDKSKPLEKSGVQVSTDLSLYTSYNEKFENPWVNEKPYLELKRDLKPNYEDSSRADFKLDAMPPGDYFVVAEASDMTGKKVTHAIWWYSVSDIGLIAKHAPDNTLVRAIDLNTLKPVTGVKIKLESKDVGHKLIAQGVTGSDGIAMISVEESQYESIVVGEWQGHTAYGSGGYFYGGSDSTTTYFYTDRPIYRLGQSVFFKGLVRTPAMEGYENDGVEEVGVVIEDPSSVQLYSGKVKTTKFGTFNGKFDIPEEGKTGAYNVKLTYSNGETAYEYFEVDQYRKPEYKIDIKPNSARINAGTKGSVTLAATYFFGGPVANARVKYSIYSSHDYSLRYKLEPRPSYYSFFDDWEDEENSYSYDYGGQFVAEGFAQTDENGEAVIEFDTPKITAATDTPSYYYEYGDKKYKIEAEVTDISKLTCTGSGSVSVTAGDFTLFVNPTSYVVQSGEPMQADILALDYDGKPVANQKVNMKVSRFPWNSVTHMQEKEVVLAQVEVVTDAEGKAHMTTAVGQSWPTDTFYITGNAVDKVGNTIVDSSSIWIASRDYPYSLDRGAADREPFKISMDKKVYKPGDTSKIMISGPFKGDEGYDALITVEGNGIYEHRIVPLNATATLVQVPIKDSFTPNVFIGVTMVAKKKQLYQETKMLMVSPNDHFLKIDINTDKQKYKPGETANYTIKASYENGKPAPNVELSLGVVDESIYSIRGENAGDIRKAFYRKRQNKVNTFCSFPETYSGGPDKMATEPKLRKNFKDTAAWMPNLITDANGVVKAKVALPDNLTTWRATVRGITEKCDVGANTQSIMVTQDIIARLALPRFWTEGDEGQINAVVHNYSDVDQDIKLTLTVSPQFKIQGALAQNLHVDKDKAARFTWPVTIANAGTGTIRLKAMGTTGGDALERTLPLRSLGVPLFESQSGVLTDKNPSVDLTLAQGVITNPSLTVSVAGSTIGQLQGSYNSLIEYPYGCTEQTMSKFIPSIIAMQLHKQLGVPLDAAAIKRFAQVRIKGMAKLSEHHHSDGGWGWWKNDDSDPYMTALVLEGLDLLGKTGYPTDKSMQDSGIKWLQTNTSQLLTQLNDPKLVHDYMYETRRCDLARVAYTMSVYKAKADPKMLDFLRANMNSFTPEPLAYTTMALKNYGDEAGARKAYERLLSLANKSATTVDWEHTRDMLKRLDLLGATDYTYRYTGEETTALALRAVLMVEPNNTNLVENIKQWILLHREKEGWANTKTTSEVLLALMTDAIVNHETDPNGVTAKIIMNNAVVKESLFAPTELYNPERFFTLPFKSADNKLRIEKDGFGKLYYHSLFGYNKKIRPGEPIPVKNTPEGLSIKREFFRLKTQPSTTPGELKLTTSPLDINDVKEGETILMKVTVNSPMSLPYVMVECPLPSGAEVVQSSGADRAADAATSEDDQSGVSGDWGYTWWSHQDVLDDKMVFFSGYVDSGKSEFHTLLRMELPGKVQLNPVTLEGMYSKLIRAYSESQELKIK